MYIIQYIYIYIYRIHIYIYIYNDIYIYIYIYTRFEACIMHALLALLLHRCCNFALDDPYSSLLLPSCCQALSTTAPDHSKLARHSVDRSSLDTDCCCYVLSKRSQRPPQMTPSLIVSGPKSSSKIDLGRVKIKPKSPRERPEAPKSAQECPRAPHERSKTARRAVPV